MSYLTRAQILRSIAAPSISVRAFSVATQRQKSAVDAAKDAVNKVNHKVADVLVDGIEIGEKVVGKTKNLAGTSSAKADKLSHEASGRASEIKGAVKGKLGEVEGDVKKKL